MKKRLAQRITAAAAASVLAVSLAGCGSSSSSSSSDSGESTQTEFTIMGAMSSLSSGYDDNTVLNELQEEAGISIEWNTISDSVEEQVNIRIAGGDYPDAFIGVGFSNYELTNYGSDGTFIDLTDYINEETMPNLTAILEENPDILSAITMSDGGIYGLPSAEQMGTAGIGVEEDYSIYTIPQYSMINKAWLDYLGLEVPTTLDELHDALQAFADNDMSHTYYGNDEGTTIPMSTGFDEWCWGQNIFYAGFGFTNWPNDVTDDLLVDENGEVYFVSVTDEYREAITYFHDWYEEGLMDTEMFSQDSTQLMAKCQQGYVGVSTWWYIEELMGDYADDYVFLPILEGPDGDYNVTVRTGGATSSGNLSITSACENPEALLAFFDLWYDPEIVMQLQYGPIDVYFTGQDEDGLWISITDEESYELYDKSAGELKSENEVSGPKLILSEYYSTTFAMEDRAIERLEDLYDYWMPYVDDTTCYPIDAVYTDEELDTIDLYLTDFENAVAEQEGLWLKNGGPTDEEWDAYVEKLTNTCGMNELLEAYQGAYDRYLAAQE